MHHHAGGFVDDGQVVVLVDDVERDLLGNGPQRRPPRLAEYADALPSPQLQRSLREYVVHQNFFFGDEMLHPRPAYVQMRHQELIEALAGGVIRDRNQDRERFWHSEGSILHAVAGTARPPW